MRQTLIWVFTVLAVLFSSFSYSAQTAEKKIRTIATTDGEIDDRCSMIRFLMYANEWDIKGLIHSASKYHWKGDATRKRHNWEPVEWLDRQIDAYEKCYPNLVKNDPDYPTPDYLRSQVFVGNIAYVGDMEKPTPGSDRIVEVLLDPDPSPVWLLAWGGSNTIARALKTIEEKHPDRVAEVARKARLFLIATQDDTMENYLLKRWPNTLLIHSTAFGAIAYRWDRIMTPELQKWFDADWMKANILSDHGPLGAMYEARDDGIFRSEGDSPSFMHLIDHGLGAQLNPAYGGWGGRFEWRENRWRSAPDDGDPNKAILRFAEAFQNDWAARADWCVKPPALCNHNPIAVCNGDRGRDVLIVDADPGAEVKLSAAGSSDPDNQKIAYQWWIYREAGRYPGNAPIRRADSAEAVVSVPEQASGRTIHVILELTDKGEPPLTSYRRVILNVSGAPVDLPDAAYWINGEPPKPVLKLEGPPPDLGGYKGKWAFYRGVNLNGPPIKIDGNPWDGDDAPNFVCKDRPINDPDVRLLPPTNEARARMIHSFRWNTSASMSFTKVPRGRYAVYAYVWEDNNPEVFDISLEGKVVDRGYRSGREGQWRRLGPWVAEIEDGSIEITSQGGAANFSGIEIWKSSEQANR